jgi:hypothetical protein
MEIIHNDDVGVDESDIFNNDDGHDEDNDGGDVLFKIII